MSCLRQSGCVKYPVLPTLVSLSHDTASNISYLPCMNVTQKIKAVVDQLNTVMVGKSAQVQDGVACLLAGGCISFRQQRMA